MFVGRVAPEKGILDAIKVAQLAGRPLRIVAKVGTQAAELAYYHDVFEPALAAAGSGVEFLGELSGEERDQLVATSYATVMPSAWPEPFGLVAIESLACGTPVITRRVGALPEIVREGIDGFFGDDVQHLASVVDRVAELDREAVRASSARAIQRRPDDRRLREAHDAAGWPAAGHGSTPAAASARRRPGTQTLQPAEQLRRRRSHRLDD